MRDIESRDIQIERAEDRLVIAIRARRNGEVRIVGSAVSRVRSLGIECHGRVVPSQL